MVDCQTAVFVDFVSMVLWMVRPSMLPYAAKNHSTIWSSPSHVPWYEFSIVLTTHQVSFIDSFIHSFLPCFLHSFIHSPFHPFIYSSIHSIIHLFMHSFIHPFIRSFIYSCIDSFIHASIHLIIHLFMHSFIHSFTHHIIFQWIMNACFHTYTKSLFNRKHYYNMTIWPEFTGYLAEGRNSPTWKCNSSELSVDKYIYIYK
jgi:hypothetical protein